MEASLTVNGVPVHVRLIDASDFKVLYVNGSACYEEAAKAIPGVETAKVAGVTVLKSSSGKPVIPVIHQSGSPLPENQIVNMAKTVHKRKEWEIARLKIIAAKAVSLAALATGVVAAATLSAILGAVAVALGVSSVLLLKLADNGIKHIVSQKVVIEEGAVGGEGEEDELSEEDYYRDAASLCYEKAQRLLQDGKSEEALTYALRSLEYASKFTRVETDVDDLQQVLQAIDRALKSKPPLQQPKTQASHLTSQRKDSVASQGSPQQSKQEGGGEGGVCDVGGILRQLEEYSGKTLSRKGEGGKVKGEVCAGKGKLDAFMEVA